MQNRYPETLRCDREYRACSALISHGFAHQVLERWVDPGPGDMVYRCVVCPRPTGPLRNMPANWEKSPYAWGYQYAWNVDGNFEAQHTVSRMAENNVFLYPGTAMFNHPDREANILRDAVDDAGLPEEKVRQKIKGCDKNLIVSTRDHCNWTVMSIKLLPLWERQGIP